MYQAQVSSKGQVVIPKEVRRAWGLQEGDRVVFVEEGGRIVLLPLPKRRVAEVLDALSGKRPAVKLEGQALLEAERRSARERREQGPEHRVRQGRKSRG